MAERAGGGAAVIRLRRAFCLAWALAAWAGAAAALPSFQQVKAGYATSDTLLLDRHGEPVQAVRIDRSARRLGWVPLAQVSPALRQALLLSEDKRFYEHSGVDWAGAGAAAWGNLWNGRTRGASTVTMQLAGLLDRDLSAPAGGRSVGGKMQQAVTALRLERSWRKDQILEAYLNLVGFRGELVGIAALSQTLFLKYPGGLDARESAIAAALVRAPNASAQAVATRACMVLRQQGRAASCSGLQQTVRQIFDSPGSGRLDADAQLAPHFARRLLAGTSPMAGQVLRTTLDAKLQRFARDTLRRQLAELRPNHVEDGALIVIDNASGDVLAWVGGSGSLSQAAEVDGVTAPRQAGSTLKPFLYELAIERRWLTAASLLDDAPVNLPTAAGLYVPENYDHEFKGPVSLRTALASSLNVPAVRALVMVTPNLMHERLKALGIPLREHGDYYGYSLALGSPEVRLSELSNAYRALAMNGRVSPLRLRADDPRAAPRPVADAGASFIVADVLSDREARVPTFGLDNALATRYWSAVKTGTSKDMRDNWCVGFSRRYTVGVWVGNASGEPMWDVSGVTGAAPVWRAVMDELYRRGKGDAAAWRTPAAPAGVAQLPVSWRPALEPPRREWFLAGTELPQPITAARAPQVDGGLIAAPVDRTIVALDPDIPQAAQKLSLVPAGGVPAGWSWRLNGKRLGPARPMSWPLWPGRHELELVDAQGRARDAVGFEVRGAVVRGRAR